MAHIYPKRRGDREETTCEYDDYGRLESCHRPGRMDPTGLDEVETSTDVYNVPHEPPRRAK